MDLFSLSMVMAVLKCSVKEQENWYMDDTFTVNIDRKNITTSNRDDEHSMYLWNKYFEMLQREERCD